MGKAQDWAAFILSINTSEAPNASVEDVLAKHHGERVWWSGRERDVAYWAARPGYVRFVSSDTQIIGRARFTGVPPRKTRRKHRPYAHEVVFGNREPILGVYMRDLEISRHRPGLYGITAAEQAVIEAALKAASRRAGQS